MTINGIPKATPGKKPIALLAAVFYFWPSSIGGAGSGGGTGFPFLRLSPPAEALAMAGARTARVGEAGSLHVNPAGLAHLFDPEVSLHSLSHLRQEAVLHVVTWARPSGRGAVGASLGWLSVDGPKKTVFDPSSPDRFIETGEVEVGAQSVGVSWGRRQTPDLAWGMSLKAVREVLDDRPAVAGLLDAGLIRRVNERHRVSAVLRHAGFSSRLGQASIQPPWEVLGGWYFAQWEWLQWEADLLVPWRQEPEASLGVELNWRRMGFLRFGYRYRSHGDGLGALAGAAAGGGVAWRGISFDYVYLPFEDLGDSHGVSLSWRFPKRGPEPR